MAHGSFEHVTLDGWIEAAVLEFYLRGSTAIK